MKRKTFTLPTLFLFAILLFTNCTKNINNTERGEIIGFDATKCGCCWGWIIKVNNDTIKADKLPNSKIKAGFEKPINVNIKIGKKRDKCTMDYDYYEIKFIKEE